MKIDVTQEMIRCGTRFSLYSCPIALAFKAVAGDGWIVGSRGCIRVTDYSREQIEFAPHVAEWIWKFDHAQAVEPISFEV